jgi:transcriptional regulator with XRE-family HTH domain
VPMKDQDACRAYQKAYRATHRDKVRAYNATYRTTHRDELLVKEKAWREANVEKVRAYRYKARGGVATRRPDNAPRDAAILAKRKEGLTLRAVAAEFGLSMARIRQVIRRHRADNRPIPITLKCTVCGRPFEAFITSKNKCSAACRRRAGLLPGRQYIVPDEMCRLWKKGRSIAEIADFFAMSDSFVQRTIRTTLHKKEVIAARRRFPPKGPKRAEAVVALRKQGLTEQAIAEEVGITRQRVSQILAKGPAIELVGPRQRRRGAMPRSS